jgi:hypothetical protein
MAFALEQQISLADGIGLGVQLLTVEMDFSILAVPFGQRAELLFAHR